MRVSHGEPFSLNGFFKLKNQDWLLKQRVAGKVCSDILKYFQANAKVGNSLLDLNVFAENYIVSNNCTPTFKNYKGFPAGVCISVNKQLVHGIPTDYKLQDGDVVSFDLGATYERAIADTAITMIVGTPKSEQHVQLIKATEASLMAGIAAVKIGSRLGSIGQAIYKSGKKDGFGVVTKYGGHGLDWDQPHASPFVDNKSEPTEGIRIQAGLAIAIEPMLTIGSPDTKIDKDGWTVVTNDIGAHFEHSIFVHQDGTVEILTNRE